jgi:hypothetical protein
MQIIHTNDRAPWRSKYQALEAKYFSNDDFLFNGTPTQLAQLTLSHINVGVDWGYRKVAIDNDCHDRGGNDETRLRSGPRAGN